MHLKVQVPLLKIMALLQLHAWPILIQHDEGLPLAFDRRLLEETKFQQCDPNLIKKKKIGGGSEDSK